MSATKRMTVAEAKFLADKAEALFQKAARAWERGNNSGDSDTMQRCERQCDNYREEAQAILKPFGIETDYPGLYPSFLVRGGTYYTPLSAISAALEAA